MSTSEETNQEQVEESTDETTDEVEESTDEATEAPAEEVAPKPEDNKVAEPKGKNIETLTESGLNGMPEGWFDNYGTPDLRTYLKFWQDEKKSAGMAEHLLEQDAEKWGWLPTRDAHIKALSEEIALREAKRSQGGPGKGPRVETPAESDTVAVSEEEMTDEELEAATAPAVEA